MVTCQHCGADIPAGARFCPRCGSYAGGPFEKAYGEIKRGYRKNTRWSRQQGLLKMIMLALLVIYAGAIMYLTSSSLTSLIGRHNAWAYLLAGLVAYLIIRVAARYLMR
ncbi:zinc ribbon domain-containing protein [Methanocella arvoryzae]|nr:zinc ribbon domain-containing protein [Methanocella arvoryzae]